MTSVRHGVRERGERAPNVRERGVQAPCMCQREGCAGAPSVDQREERTSAMCHRDSDRCSELSVFGVRIDIICISELRE